MEKKTKDHIIDTLDDLDDNGLNRFKDKLGDTSFQERKIAKGTLQHANSVEVACLIMSTFTETHAAANTIAVLNAINQAQLAEQLKEKVKAAPPPKKRTKSPCADNIGTVKEMNGGSERRTGVLHQSRRATQTDDEFNRLTAQREMNGGSERWTGGVLHQSRRAMQMDNELKRQTAQRAKCRSHLNFIDTCIDNAVVPTGFKIKLSVNMKTSEAERLNVNQILKETSFKVMQEAKLTLARRIREISNEIEIVINDMNCMFPPSEMRQLLRKVDNLENKTLEHLNNKKLMKLHKLIGQPGLQNRIGLEKIKISNHNNSENKENTVETLSNRMLEQCEYKSYDDYNIVQKEKDGNCFFRCLAVVLYGSQNDHRTIRHNVIELMESNMKQYEMNIDSVTHIEKMKLSDGSIDSWATEAEVMAAVDLLNRPIHVYIDLKNKDCFKYEGTIQTIKNKNDPINLLYNNNHFSVIVFKDNETGRKSEYCGIIKKDNQNKSKTVKINQVKVNDKMQNRELNMTKTENSKQKDRRPKNRHDTKYTKDKTEDIVLNLSSKTLTTSQKTVLSKGLKFIPTKRYIDKDKLATELKEWERHMRLAEYFFNENISDSEGNYEHGIKVNSTSTWTPPDGRDKWLDMYIEVVKQEIMVGLKKRCKRNLTNIEEQAMTELLNDDDIMIRPADKGSGIVIMNTDDYMKSVQCELNNTDTYEEVKSNKINKSVKEVKEIAERLYNKGIISKELKKYMQPNNARTGLARGNPKMHKENHPLRMIVSRPTDMHQYLHMSSAHPIHTKRAIPKGLGMRIRRICSKESDSVKQRNVLKTNLKKRGYKETIIETELRKVDKLKRDYKNRDKKVKRVPLIMTYSKLLPNISKIVWKHLRILHNSEKLKKVFLKAPVVAFKREANLGDILVHSKHKRIIDRIGSTKHVHQ
ncbi:uncharacterized protein LOC117966565 isoform X1 [Acipenser ruthenus]|uniref:uncharacterized protein LOC117966565 isoform X1 n=1 Tax=Acipenser ruthenus TaxID=7906 RepID=UPI0027426981|nr:uncharacterized protein LOC117966565 isoform X1 [Acipenser ruthenus]